MPVDLRNGLRINGVMMKTTMLVVTGMVELAVTIIRRIGMHIAKIVNALSQVQISRPKKSPALTGFEENIAFIDC